jgi:signal transduction histidine kinase
VDILSKLLEQLHEPWRPINVSPTNVNTCLRNARDKILPENSSENIKVELDLVDTLPPVETSSDMLLEAFSILMKNAKEAIETRGSTDGHLRITSRLCEESLIKVQIEDNGTGIKPENKGKVFEMRWSTKESGLGFGLFWAKDFIEGLGGKIWVDSVWQQKTTFYVELPCTPHN